MRWPPTRIGAALAGRPIHSLGNVWRTTFYRKRPIAATRLMHRPVYGAGGFWLAVVAS